MGYDEELAGRVRSAVGAGPEVTEKRMFGGLALLLHGNMAVVVRGRGGLMVRVDPGRFEQFCTEPGAEPTEMRGRSMRGWITLDEPAYTRPADLRRWVKRALDFTRGLPPK